MKAIAVFKEVTVCDNTVLDKVDKFKDLEVLFDQYLLFNSHISEKARKAYVMLGIIKQILLVLWRAVY